MNAVSAMIFPLSTDFIVSHRIWYVVPSLYLIYKGFDVFLYFFFELLAMK